MRRNGVALCALILFPPTLLAAQAPSAPTPEWRRGGVCYEVFVRSFHDSDGDGVGDLRGLTSKLDYINDGSAASEKDLGASCIWLMPVAQSPSYHGYDVTHYYEVNREYGTNYTREEIFFAADVIDTIREIDRKRVEVNGDLLREESDE